MNSIEYFGRQKGERGLQGESMKSLRAMRKLLIQYADENEYGQNNDAKNENDIKICRVYYTDGEVEDLTLQAFDRLIRSDTWRLQVLLLQGFVPFLSEMEGYYSDKPKVLLSYFVEFISLGAF